MTDLSKTYIEMATLMAKNSKAIRKKVGAALVTPHGTVLLSYNGTPRGLENVCEDENNVTKPTVIHAETNCILKAAREGVSVVDSTLYVTLSPCLQCSAMIIQAGITKVVYNDDYRDLSGIEFLKEAAIEVIKLEREKHE